MNIIAIVGSLCLIGLQIISRLGVGGKHVKTVLLAWLLGVLAGAALIYQGSQAVGLYQRSYMTPFFKYSVDLARNGQTKAARNVVIVEGGSHAARGVLYDALEARLKARGYSAVVIPLSIPGANHFERYWIFKKFFDRAGGSWAGGKSLVLLREICQGYDRNPVEQFVFNLYSDRTLFYVQPEVSLKAIDALWRQRGSEGPLAKRLDLPAIKELALHGAMNAFNIGLLSRTEFFGGVKSAKPANALEGKGPKLKFNGIGDLVQSMAQTERRGASLDWKRELVDREILSRFPVAPKIAYYPMPTLYGENYIQQKEYELAFPGTPILSFRKDAALAGQFDDAQLWYDTGHLNVKGAKLFTTWLADKLIESGLLQK